MLILMIVVVEGPSAAGKTTWCRRHAPRWLPEPGRWTMAEILRYQRDRWRKAVDADTAGELIVLDGDPFKLYCTWAQRKLDQITEADWRDEVERFRRHFARNEYGLADLVLYADPPVDVLIRHKEADSTRTRRNFDLHIAMRPYFRQWYEAVADLDRARVLWEHPSIGITEALIKLGPRPARSGADLFDRLLDLIV
jgi:hypothetical protein